MLSTRGAVAIRNLSGGLRLLYMPSGIGFPDREKFVLSRFDSQPSDVEVREILSMIRMYSPARHGYYVGRTRKGGCGAVEIIWVSYTSPALPAVDKDKVMRYLAEVV